MRGFMLLVGLGCLTACSGGDGESSGGTPAPPSVPTLTVSFDRDSQIQEASEADTRASFAFSATYSGSSGGAPVYPKVSFDTAVLALDGDIATPTGNSFAVKLKSLDTLSAEPRSGDVTFRLCRDPDCATVYPGSTRTFRYLLDMKLLDWTMLQRDAKHRGFVHASFDPQKITKAWEQNLPGTLRYQPVSTKGDTVFVTRVGTANGAANGAAVTTVHALNSATGAQRWSYEIGSINSASGPTVTGDTLQIASMIISSDENRIITLESATGRFVRNMLFAAQWSQFAQPTAIDRELYLAAGYYGNVVYSYDLDDGRTALGGPRQVRPGMGWIGGGGG